MDFLLQLFEEAKLEFISDDFMSTSLNAGWAKLDKYYTKTEDTPVYNAAVVLNPGFKWDYFESVWSDHPDWIIKAKEDVKRFWESELCLAPLRQSF
jgi:hypothetical protein